MHSQIKQATLIKTSVGRLILLTVARPDGTEIQVPLDLEATEALMSRLTRLLPKLREAQAQREHALQAAAQEATGLSPGDRVKITAGSATGRRGTVIEVTTQKITVTQVEGLLSNERLQLQPNEVQRL